jgi:hypothetical protein
VAAGIRRSATRRNLAADWRRAVDKATAYLLGYKHLLLYDRALDCGYPIASGVIEGACRHLVNVRMNRSGARWSLSGAEAVLRLRSLVKSGDFGDYWKLHEARERERNHLDRYADRRQPRLAGPSPTRPTLHRVKYPRLTRDAQCSLQVLPLKKNRTQLSSGGGWQLLKEHGRDPAKVDCSVVETGDTEHAIGGQRHKEANEQSGKADGRE